MSFSLLSRCWCARDRSNQTLDVIRQQLQLGCRQAEPAPVVDGSLTINEDDETVLAAQHGVHLLVNTERLVLTSLSPPHDQNSAVMFCDGSVREVEERPEPVLEPRTVGLDRRSPLVPSVRPAAAGR
jgi:hypothetical protein